jgi:endonuclease/exonuclease/phosphatase (EEP) superfamily protein YafD
MENPPDTAPAPTRRAFSFKRLLVAACDVYSAGLILYLILNLLFGDRLWPVALAQNLAPWLLLAGIGPLAAQLMLRERARAVLAAVPVAAFLAIYGVFFLPDLTPAPACAAPGGGCPTLTVMTYNLGSGLADPDQLVAALQESEADIVALIEFDGVYVEPVSRELSAKYPYQALYPQWIAGKALLSRYPIIEDSGLFWLETPQPHMTATLDVDGWPLRVVIAHAPRPSYGIQFGYVVEPGTLHDFQTLAGLATEGGPAILLGDFNAADQTGFYRVLVEAGLHDAFREAGWGLGATYPNRMPTFERFPALVRIDYIWHTEDFAAERAWIGPDAGSDHRSLLAELRRVR